jgi:hypothetical protein
MQSQDLENADSVGGDTLASFNMEDEEQVHDQLPSLEEYKTNMTGAVSSPRGDNDTTTTGDEEDVAVHDQLPSVEEVKASMAPPKQTKNRCQKCLCIFAVLFVIAIIAVAIIVPTLVLTKDEYNPLRISSRRADVDEYNPLRISSRRADVVDYLLKLEISTEDHLSKPGTPQYDAATWIADDDAYYMPIPKGDTKHSRFVERYVMAVFYYSTGGPNWSYKMNFLEPLDICNWNQDFITSSGSRLRLGVNACGEVGQVGINNYLTLKMGLRK